jgi:hypothetical protein
MYHEPQACYRSPLRFPGFLESEAAQLCASTIALCIDLCIDDIAHIKNHPLCRHIERTLRQAWPCQTRRAGQRARGQRTPTEFLHENATRTQAEQRRLASALAAQILETEASRDALAAASGEREEAQVGEQSPPPGTSTTPSTLPRRPPTPPTCRSRRGGRPGSVWGKPKRAPRPRDTQAQGPPCPKTLELALSLGSIHPTRPRAFEPMGSQRHRHSMPGDTGTHWVTPGNDRGGGHAGGHRWTRAYVRVHHRQHAHRLAPCFRRQAMHTPRPPHTGPAVTQNTQPASQ